MYSDRDENTNSYRLTVLGLCLTFGLAVVVAQLVRYQVITSDQLQEQARLQREKTLVLSPLRGYIADANGSILSMNSFLWDISVSPELVIDPDQTAADLAPFLGTDIQVIHTKLTADAMWMPLARYVPHEIGEAIAGLNANGITCTPMPQRIYPMADLVSHPLGIVNSTGNGFYGVEGYYNLELNGITGTLEIEIDPYGQPLPRPPHARQAPKPSANLILTLDANIQHIAEEELRRALDQSKAESGTVIVMDPKTGSILADVSLPAYDPNEFATVDSDLLADPAVSRMWEPGSIFKIVTWGAGLDSGVITPDTTVRDNGQIEVGGRVIENSDRQAHGEVTMTEALALSLNTVAAHISISMGKDHFYNYLRRFGFGNLTGVDLASEGPGRVKLPGDSDWFPSELGTNSFGQGIAVTPMQMITAVSAVANRGLMMRPHIVRQRIIEEYGGQRTIIVNEPKVVRQVISREAAATLTEMLVEVVERQATEALIPGYRIAGKTGTAQIPTAVGYDPTDTIVSFVGYAPADDPQFIILVKLDRPKTSRWAGSTATPAFRAIAESLLVYLHIPPDEIRLAQN